MSRYHRRIVAVHQKLWQRLSKTERLLNGGNLAFVHMLGAVKVYAFGVHEARNIGNMLQEGRKRNVVLQRVICETLKKSAFRVLKASVAVILWEVQIGAKYSIYSIQYTVYQSKSLCIRSARRDHLLLT